MNHTSKQVFMTIFVRCNHFEEQMKKLLEGTLFDKYNIISIEMISLPHIIFIAKENPHVGSG